MQTSQATRARHKILEFESELIKSTSSNSSITILDLSCKLNQTLLFDCLIKLYYSINQIVLNIFRIEFQTSKKLDRVRVRVRAWFCLDSITPLAWTINIDFSDQKRKEKKKSTKLEQKHPITIMKVHQSRREPKNQHPWRGTFASTE